MRIVSTGKFSFATSQVHQPVQMRSNSIKTLGRHDHFDDFLVSDQARQKIAAAAVRAGSDVRVCHRETGPGSGNRKIGRARQAESRAGGGGVHLASLGQSVPEVQHDAHGRPQRLLRP
jgi:hypothetical protein